MSTSDLNACDVLWFVPSGMYGECELRGRVNGCCTGRRLDGGCWMGELNVGCFEPMGFRRIYSVNDVAYPL